MGRGREFPKLEHRFNKAGGELSGREGGQGIILSPLAAVAQTLARVTKESARDALLPPRARRCAARPARPQHPHPAEDVTFPRNSARPTLLWLQIAPAQASSTRGCEGEGRLGNIPPFVFLGFADVSSPVQLGQLNIY